MFIAQRTIFKLIFASTIAIGAAHATLLADLDGILLSTDPTQLGRLTRNGIASDWSSPKPFPGFINLTTAYRFETFAVNVGGSSFIQIDFDEIGGTANLFASAYLNSYNPASPSTNYLGDPGLSGDFFGVDPQVFQVIVPANQNVIVVVNDTTSTGAGVGINFNIKVEGFVDSQFDEIPEPAPLWLPGIGLVVLGIRLRRHGMAG